MLDLIEHLASGVKDVPLLILCLARKDLLDERPTWGGGNVRSTSIELEALPLEDSAQLVDALVAGESAELSDEQREAVLATTEGNPLFIEETVRMLLESGGESDGYSPHRPGDDLRQDRPAAGRPSARCCGGPPSPGACSGRARSRSSATRPINGGELHDLVERDFLVREPRSTIRGEEAYRFKHVLIRDVAYAGLSKSSRALLHRQMADWLAERPVGGRARRDPRLPPRRGRRARRRSSRGASPDGARGRGGRCPRAGGSARARARGEQRRPQAVLARRRARAERSSGATSPRTLRGACPTSRPSRPRCTRSARQRARAGDHRVEVRALTALARVSLFRDADNACARELAGQGARRRRGGRRRGPVRRARGASARSRTGRAISRRSSGSRTSGSRSRSGSAATTSRAACCSSSTTSTTPASRPERAHEPLALAIELAGDEREPDDAGLDPARVRPAGGDRGPARRRRGRARARRERSSPRAARR